MSAVLNGKSIDTSMGLTPLEGLIMGTRSGDLDPAIVEFIAHKENLTAEEVNTILNKKSGVAGISGVSSDFRDLDDAAEKGHEKAILALDMFNYRVVKYIGAYVAALGGVDAIAFTAGVGENNGIMRGQVMKRLEFLGIKIDAEKNTVRSKETIVSTPDSKVKVIVVPTNEELAIARETLELLK